MFSLSALWRVVFWVLFTWRCIIASAVDTWAASPARPLATIDSSVSIQDLAADPRGGRGYRLVYRVALPLDRFWQFKTDFDNDFLLQNKYIREHRVVSRLPGTVITENKYAIGPDVPLRWRTTVANAEHRLDFVLLDAEGCGQRFHYGFIQLQPDPDGTLVIQVAYFDFLGAGLWADYPWGGGMSDFLRYTAEWEQSLAWKLKQRDAEQAGQ